MSIKKMFSTLVDKLVDKYGVSAPAYAVCAECGSNLQAWVDEDAGELYLQVLPCETCLEEAKHDGETNV